MTAIIMLSPTAWHPIWKWIEAAETFATRGEALDWIKTCNMMGKTP